MLHSEPPPGARLGHPAHAQRHGLQEASGAGRDVSVALRRGQAVRKEPPNAARKLKEVWGKVIQQLGAALVLPQGGAAVRSHKGKHAVIAHQVTSEYMAGAEAARCVRFTSKAGRPSVSFTHAPRGVEP